MTKEIKVVTEGQINFEKELCDHFIGEIPDEFTKPISYIFQRNGVWEVRKTDIGLFTRQMVELETPGLSNPVNTDIEEMYVPLIPISILGEAVSFFRKIWKTMRAESFVQVIYNPDTDEYFAFCPKQKVSGGGVFWEVAEGEMPDGVRVLEIHSHCDFDTFFSGTDNADEKGDGFYGVVGKLNNFMPDISFRLVLGGEEYDADVEDIFDLNGDVYHSEFPAEWLDNVTKAPVQTVVAHNPDWAGKKWDSDTKKWTPSGPENKTPAVSGLTGRLQQNLFKDDDDDDDDDDLLELSDEEREIYSKYLEDYYKEEDSLSYSEQNNNLLHNNHMDMGRK